MLSQQIRFITEEEIFLLELRSKTKEKLNNILDQMESRVLEKDTDLNKKQRETLQ
jgi:hypothetical protein